MKKLTKEEFIEKARNIHGDKYDYSKVEYVNTRTKVCIVCPVHGEFLITPNMHLSGVGCKKCSNEEKSLSTRKTTEEFIEEARKIHGYKYDYSKVEYKGNNKRVCIICPKHGEFWQTPSLHLRTGGCQKCSDEKRSIVQKFTNEDFIDKAKAKHGDKYDYSKVIYTGCNDKVCIVCPEHGEFWQVAYMHLSGQGCRKCGDINKNKDRVKDINVFIEESKSVHGDKYDYSKVKYINNHTKVCIICPKHGEFWQTPNRHLIGNGCPTCKESKMEHEIAFLLDKNNIKYERQKKFVWLGKQSLDFYLPDYNVAIECQGIQHFFSSKNEKSYYTKENIKKIQQRDRRKLFLCSQNNIEILYYSNVKGIVFPYEVITEKNNILKKIKNV